jgi:hypothetical protein
LTILQAAHRVLVGADFDVVDELSHLPLLYATAAAAFAAEAATPFANFHARIHAGL